MSTLIDIVFHQLVPMFFALILAGILLGGLIDTVREMIDRRKKK